MHVFLTPSELGKATGYSATKIRDMERDGEIAADAKTISGIRLYGLDKVETVKNRPRQRQRKQAYLKG